MELLNPSSSMADFKFESASSSPFISASSSPQRFGSSFYSAPASPTRVSAFCRYDFFDLCSGADGGGAVSAVPFGWEEKPGIAKSDDQDQSFTAVSSNYGDAEEDLADIDFEFDFSGQLERVSLSADELFDGGKIKPLKPPPRFQYEQVKNNNNNNQKPQLGSPKSSPRSPKRMIREAFSPRRRKEEDMDPFAAALRQTQGEKVEENEGRGRERSNYFSGAPSKSRHKATRSLSPLRVSDLLFDPEINQEPTENQSSVSSSSASTLTSLSSFWYKKWKIKDLLLFRSASESHASDKEQMNIKLSSSLKNIANPNEIKNSSFRSTDGSSNGSVSKRRRRSGPRISAHEMHYTVNRAVSEEMKKRTFLPYRQGLLGCLGFQQALNPEISKSFCTTSSWHRV